jgi:hypothetical protein
MNFTLAHAQDSTAVHRKKNTIRINITNPLIFGESYILGYERTIGRHQSFTINVGSYSLPNITNKLRDEVNSADIALKGTTESFGMHTSIDYRFYLAKENKYDSPHGVYIGPFVSYNFMDRTNNWNLNTANFQGDITTDLKIDIITGGVQLGYQFLFWKDRLALDMVLIGPGMSQYLIEAKSNTALDVGDEQELLDAINEILNDKLPGYSLVIDDAEFKRSGSVNTTSFGFRYIIHFGFRF